MDVIVTIIIIVLIFEIIVIVIIVIDVIILCIKNFSYVVEFEYLNFQYMPQLLHYN